MIPQKKLYLRKYNIYFLVNFIFEIFIFIKDCIFNTRSKVFQMPTLSGYMPVLTINSEGSIACNGCNICVKLCPSNCIKIKHDSKKELKVSIDYSRCTSCFLCEEVCPINAIKLIKRMKYLGSRQRQTVVCQKSLAFDEDINNGKGIKQCG